MKAFLDNPAVQTVGWALLHFIWQAALLSAILAIANLITKSARTRYAAGCAVMLMMPVIFIATILRTERPPAPVTLVSYAEPLYISTGRNPAGHATIVASAPIAPPHYNLSTIPGWIACLWLIGVAVFSILTAAGWLRIHQLTQRGTEPANPACLEVLQILQSRLKISKPIRLCTSAIAEVPTVIGWLRPYILLPLTAITGLDESQLRAILAHELAHIRRHDYLINLLQNAVETLLFYHPAVWWVSRQIRQEREHCCDDLAVEVCGDVMLYATALTQLEQLQGSNSEPALAATGGDLLARIRRLMGRRDSRSPGRIAGSIAALTTVALIISTVIGIGHTPAIHAQSPPAKTAQPAPPSPITPVETAQLQPVPAPKASPTPAVRPEFETASIRPAAPRVVTTSGPARSGGAEDDSHNCGIQHLTEDESLVTYRCITLRGLVQFAYGIGQDPGAMAGPDWLVDPDHGERQRFDIEAKLPRGATKDQVPAMFRSLLESRFHLSVHSGMQEQPVDALVVDKGGLKLKAGSPDSVPPGPGPDARPCPPQSLTCSPTITYRRGEQIAMTPLAAGIRQFSSQRIGTALVTHPPGTPTTRIEAPGTTLGGLAELLDGMVPLPVVDMTGTDGRYEVTLEISVDMHALMTQAFAESPAAQAAQAGPITGPNPAIDAATQKAGTDRVEATQKALQNALLKLGIRLEQRKAPIDTLIVDHVEKLPSDN